MPTLYRKSDFQSFILTHITKGVSVNGRPATSVSDMLGFSLAFVGVGTGFFLIGILILWSEPSFAALFFTVFPLLFVTVGVWKYFQLGAYRNLEKYFEIKEFLLEKQSTLDTIRIHDRDQSGINPIGVESFASTLTHVSHAYRKLEVPIKKIQKGKKNFSKDIEQKLLEFITTESSWMIDYMHLCRDITRSWSSHHEEELRNIVENLKNTETSMLAGKEALDLVEKRLESHIYNLEKVRVLL